ncbi:hypothetical protein FRB97_008817, partial [Tulasnella sp. 331]
SKPSCKACLIARNACVYGERKTRITADDLHDKLQKLQQKYAACLKAAKLISKTGKCSKKSTRREPSRQGDDNARCSDEISTAGTNAVGPVHLSTYTSSLPNTDHPYGGYHFDDKFLLMPSPTKDVARLPLTSNHIEDTRHLTPHPTRIFTTIPRTPTLSTVQSPPHSDSLVPFGSPPSVDDGPPTKRRRLTPPPLVYGLIPWQPEANASPDQQDTQDSKGDPTDAELSRYRTCNPKRNITQAPGLHFSRATWWDYLLDTYTIRPDTSDVAIPRALVTAEITQDVRVFFKATPLWIAYFNIPLFFDTFYHPDRRAAIQPALILGILAYAKLMQSNYDMSRGQSSRERDRAWRQSMVLKDLAQASFEASYNAGWIDVCLAQAASILALYEMCPHKDYAPHRMGSASYLLDNVLRVLGLTTIDAMDLRAPTFAPDTAPCLGRPLPNGAREYTLRYGDSSTAARSWMMSRAPCVMSPAPPGSIRYQGAMERTPFESWPFAVTQQRADRDDHRGLGISVGCPCQALALSETPELPRSIWLYVPRWAPNGSLTEIRKEEARRLVWTSVIMLGCDAIGRRAAGLPQINLYATKPENFRLLFPGEDDYSSLPDVDAVHSGKE